MVGRSVPAQLVNDVVRGLVHGRRHIFAAAVQRPDSLETDQIVFGNRP